MSKQRIFAIFLSLAMIMSFMPSMAFAADGDDPITDHEFTAPTDLKWEPVTGRAEFTITDNEGYHVVNIYHDGVLRSTAYGCTSGTWFAPDIDDSGTYTFDVCVTDSMESFLDAMQNGTLDNLCRSALSEPFVYTKEDKTVLATPQNVKWSETEYGKITWDPVENAECYFVSLMDNDNPVSAYGDVRDTSCDWSKLVSDINNHSYTVRVRAITGDFSKYANGTFSENSDILKATSSMDDASAAVSDAANNANAENIESKVSTLKTNYSTPEQKEVLRNTIQSSTETQNDIVTLENCYTNAKNITVEKAASTNSYIDANKVSVIGAGFSAEAGSTVKLNVADPVKDHNFDNSQYSGVLGFSMTLTNEKGEEKKEVSELDIPVTITLPIPQNMDRRFLFILHYLADGSYETISPSVISDGNGGYSAKFTITHFSDFAFAESRNRSVTLDANGGTVDPDSIVVKQGETYGGLPAPIYSGHTFEGWFTEKNGGTKINNDTIVNISSEQTLYAHWKANSSDVPSEGGGTSGGGAATPEPTEADNSAAASVSSSISVLPNAASLSDASAVASARSAYDKLTAEQKALVEKAALTKLENAEKSLAKAITDSVNALPETVTLDNEAAVKAACDAYSVMTASQQALVEKPVSEKLVSAEKVIKDWNEFEQAVESAENKTIKSIKVKALKAGKANITWKQDKTASGYIVQYSTSKKFKKNISTKTIKKSSVTKLTVKKLKKGKTYYFRIRPVSQVQNTATGDMTKVYGSWSKAKKTKAKNRTL